MIYISHLVLDDEMKALVNEYGTGIESIDFSISDNLDQLSDSIKTYWQKMKEIGTRDLILHGPFLDVNPCAYDSLVREATMTRFNQCYEAGLQLGAKKIVFHSGMNPYVYYKEYWAEHVAKFWKEFMKNKTELEVVLENVFDDDWRLLLDVYKKVNQPNFKLCLDIGHAHCYSSLDVREWAKNLYVMSTSMTTAATGIPTLGLEAETFPGRKCLVICRRQKNAPGPLNACKKRI